MENSTWRRDLVIENVDDLYQRAGIQDVIHLHGKLNSPLCMDYGQSHYHPGVYIATSCNY
ncbi:hypothetical protein ICJ33_16815 [Pseudomonas simiae]|nr:hypothetical protein ICJ33_16815 [Pseudomonas simiae]